MICKILISFLFISVNCFSSTNALFNKDVHVPPSSKVPHIIRFCTTRTSDDGSLKSDLLKQLKTIFEVGSFVETGTCIGNTTIKAANIFEEIHTIELSQELYSIAFNRLEPWENTTVHLGSSEQILESLLPNIHRRILFYLDGHYSGYGTARGSLDTPILKELQAIENANKADSIILIDDVLCFQDSYLQKSQSLNYGLETYPDLKEVIIALLQINPSYQICFLGDALLAFPKDQGICVSPVTRACALQRLEYLCADLSDEELKNEAQVIGKAESDEKEELGIYYQMYSQLELDCGYRSYACLWYALILQEDGHKEQALSLIKNAANNSIPNWRVCQCINRLVNEK